MLTTCISILNPSVIAIGGSMSNSGEHLIAGIREVAYGRSMPMATEHLAIVQSEAGENAAILGASMLAIDHALSPKNLDLLERARASADATEEAPQGPGWGVRSRIDGETDAR